MDQHPFGGREEHWIPSVLSYSSAGNLVSSVLFPLSFCLRALIFLFLSEQINDKSKKSDDESEDEDNPAKLQKKRDWDEWKDG